jgi:phosphoribosylformimino-5-aminoimidazole carboxamide ribotide isomerase/phosphoribosylanthranilate isomerase
VSGTKYLELLPAVDVKDGRAVRLVQGELERESVYGQPLEVALEFQAAGAEWLHLVDLDAAFEEITAPSWLK